MVKVNNKYELIVIGAGSAGLVAASLAVSMGARVLLVESRKMGGDCLNYGCVPSKTFLKSCHLAHAISKGEKYGIHNENMTVVMKEIKDRVASVIAEIAPHDSVERFESLGVDVVIGHGKIITKHQVEVCGEIYEGKSMIISTGSRAFIPNIPGLEEVHYYTNEEIFEVEELPKNLIVIGSGPIGLELGQGFAHLGSKVHFVTRAKKLFPKDEPEVEAVMRKQFEDDKMKFFMESEIKEVIQEGNQVIVIFKQGGIPMEVRGDLLLLAVGRVPNIEGLGLEQLGIEVDQRNYIQVNDKLQTNISNIYACGDVRGKFQFTHMASYEAGIAVKNALITPRYRVNYSQVVWTTYTLPEVAHVGYNKEQAENEDLFGEEYSLDLNTNDRAMAEGDTSGFVKVILDRKGRIIGGTIVGDKAGEMLPIISYMVAKKCKLTELLSVIYQYPIEGEILKTLAIDAFKAHVAPWQKKIVEKIVRR